jgi:hypothetical protein
MASLVMPNAIQITQLTALLGAVPYSTAKLHLCSLQFPILPTTPLSAFTAGEAAWGGYAPKVLTWGTPYLNQAGNVVADALATFIQTVATPTETDFMAFITDTGTTELLASWILDVPLNFTGIGTGGSLQISMGLNNGTALNVP